MLPKLMLATAVAAIIGGVSGSPIDACPAPSSNNVTPQPVVVEQVAPKPVAVQKPEIEQPKKLVLAPTTPPTAASDNDPSLSKEDNFYWNLPEEGIFANMSVEVKPGYRLLNGNNFASLVDRVDCSANSTIKVTFSSDEHVKSAQKSWAWVNKEPANTVIYIVDDEKCGGKHGRQPYFVSSVQYNTLSKTASMKASTAAWESFVHDAELEIKGDNQPAAAFDGPSKRFLSKNFPINIAHDFSQNIISTDFHGVNLGFDCLDCSTHGTLDAAINLSFSKGFSASVTMRDDVALRVGLGLSASGAVAGPFLTKSIRVGQLGLPGFSIGGIAEIGPQLTLDAQATLGTASAKLEAKFGGVMSFENGQKIQIGKGATATIHPTFSAIPPSLDAEVSIAAKVNPLVTLNLSALFFGKGITGGIALAAPILSVSAGANVTTTGLTCGGHASVNFAVDVGVEVDGFAGFGSPGDLPNKTVLFALNQPLINQCVAILK